MLVSYRITGLSTGPSALAMGGVFHVHGGHHNCFGHAKGHSVIGKSHCDTHFLLMRHPLLLFCHLLHPTESSQGTVVKDCNEIECNSLPHQNH